MESCLHQDRKGMTRALMEVIASGTVSKPEEVGRYARCTLLAATHAEKDFKVATDPALSHHLYIICRKVDLARYSIVFSPKTRSE